MLRFVLLTVLAIVAVDRARSAELDAAPASPIARPDSAGVDPQAARQAAASDDAARPDRWRYIWHSGRWWYWTAKNRWLYWSEPQGWVAYQTPAAPAARAAAPTTRAPAGDSWRWGWDPANPFDRYPPGRPINSPKMFPKNM
jgi:hypothetical protein